MGRLGRIESALNDLLNTIENVIIPDGSITAAKIADSAVTSGKINNGSVITDKIADGAITSGKIGNGSVVTDKITDSAITSGKIGNGSVITDKVADGAITGSKIASNTIDAGKLKLTVVDFSGNIPIQTLSGEANWRYWFLVSTLNTTNAILLSAHITGSSLDVAQFAMRQIQMNETDTRICISHERATSKVTPITMRAVFLLKS